MIAGRSYVLAHELDAIAPHRPWWPAISIALLCGLAVVLPPGALTAMNLYLLAIALLVVLASRQVPPRPLVLVMAPFAAMIVIGLFAGHGSDRYLYFKDAWYVSNPAVLIAVGFVLGRMVGDTARSLRAFVIGGTLVSIGHLLWFVINPELLSLRATQIRSISGTGYYATGLAALILLAHRGRWPSELKLGAGFGGVCLALCLASSILSFSRTMALVVIVGALAVAGFFSRREWLRVGLLVAVGVAAILVLQTQVDTQSVQAKNSFAGKMARSFEEMQLTERMTVREVNDNWRGYESARALATWRAGNEAQLAFGQGFGAQVDVGLFQVLSPNPRDAVRFIPILHNGYAYVLVKTGLVGILLYLTAVAYLYVLGRREALRSADDPARRIGRLLQACAVVLLITTWVIGGAFNKFDLFSVLMLIGLLMAALLRLQPEAR